MTFLYIIPLGDNGSYDVNSSIGGFLRKEWAVGTHADTQKRKAHNLTEHAFPIQSDQFCNFSFLTIPPIYSPCTRPVKQF